MLKTLIFAVIVLVIPVFFVFIFVNSLRNRLSALRKYSRTTAARLAEEFAARRMLIPTLVEALMPVFPDEGPSLNTVRTACEAAESTARTRTAQPDDEAMARLLAAAEAVLDESLEKLLAVAQSNAEVRASAAFGDLFDRVAAANQRVDAARQAWEESEAALAAARARFPGRMLSHSRE